MRLSFSSSIILVLLTGLVAAEIPSASDANVQARANVGNILEERWNEPHKTKPWHQPTHTHKPPNQYQPHKHPGDRCHYDKECNSWKCNKGKCVSKPGQGHHGNYCNDHGQCGSGLYCRFVIQSWGWMVFLLLHLMLTLLVLTCCSTGKNTCQSKKPAGQSCATGNSCSSATCFRNKCINNHSIPLHKPCGGDVSTR